MADVAEAETIGQRIRRERIAADMTQRDLARLVEVGVPHISKVESDRESPSDGLLGRLAAVFEVDPDELLLVARRVPEHVVEKLAAQPDLGIQFLRSWPPKQGADLKSQPNEGAD